MNGNIIVSHSLVHFMFFIYYYRKEGISIRSILWLYLCVFTIGGVLLLLTGKYFEVMAYPHFSIYKEIEIMPYILNILFSYLLISCLGNVKENKLRNNLFYNTTVNKFIRFIFIIEVIYTILKVLQIFIVIKIGFGNFHDLPADIQEKILYGSFPPFKYLNYVGKFCNIVVFPYILTHQFIGYKYNKVPINALRKLFAIFCVNSVISGCVSGNRASVLFGIMNICFFAVLFIRIIPPKYIKYGFGIASICFCIFFILFQMIATERFSNIAANDSLFRYWGECYLNLGFEYWDNIDKFTNGHFIFRDFYDIRLIDLMNKTNVNIHWFTTGYGYLYIDYGAYIPILIAVIYSIFVRIYVSGHYIHIHKIPIIMYMFQICYKLPFGGYNMAPFDLFLLLCMCVVPIILDCFFIKKQNHSY